jgi:hypothetical protein
MGASLALPLLDGMVPAFASELDTAAKPATRFSVVYVPNGMVMDKWIPKAEGAGFEMSPILEPLAPFRDQITVLTGLVHKQGMPLPGEGGGDHARGTGSFLTGMHPKKTEGPDIQAGVSVDQIAAKTLGKQTQVPSLELAIENSAELVGETDAGYSGAYINTLCWSSPTTALPMECQPRAVFERLFGDSDSTDRAARLARIREDRSLLDSVVEEVKPMMSKVGLNDRNKLTEYLDAVRGIEQRIQLAEEQSSRELPVIDRPVGIPPTFEEHVKLMFDLQVLAFQTDLTRVITFMMAREKSTRAYREIGVSEPHHPLSHHKNDPKMLDGLATIQTYHVKMFGYFLEKLQATSDGNGSLLDHTMVLYGSSLSDSNQHLHDNLPILLAGGKFGRIQSGRHIRYEKAKEMPVSNLLVTMLDNVGVPVEEFAGDATGTLELLSV